MYKKIIVLGANGLIGNNIYKYLKYKKLDIIPAVRNSNKKICDKKNLFYGNLVKKNKPYFYKLKKIINISDPDLIINCIGITKHKKKNKFHFDILNYKLLKFLLKFKIKIINFSTDCIFLGQKGSYKENSLDFDNTYYAKSKIKAEVLKSKFLITLRTSAYGKEMFTKNGLFEWFMNQKKAYGYQFAYFSGPTCHEIAQIIYKYIVVNKIVSSGLFNIGGKKISKYKLLNLTKNVFSKNTVLLKTNKFKINRSLNTTKFRNLTKYKFKSWKKMISEMKKFDEKSF